MDNSTTTWIMVALLLLLIAAAVYMLLRRPGGDGSTAVDKGDVTGVDAPGAAGNTGTDVLAEGRDLGPGTAAPEVDSLRGRADEPFDQHAETDERRHDDVAADQAGVADEDQGAWREAAAVGAAGTAGAGAVAATRDEEPTAADEPAPQETEYVVREDDHEPVPASDVEPVEDTYAAPVAEDTTYAAPVEDTDEDRGRWRDAAAIGASGAAGAAVAGAADADASTTPATGDTVGTAATPATGDTVGTAATPATGDTVGTAATPATGDTVGTAAEEPALEEPAQDTTWDDTFAYEPADSAQVTTDEVGAATADVHTLSTEEIDAGAREESLPADEQAPLAPEDVSGADAAAHGDEVVQDDHSDTDRQGWRDAAAIGAAGAAGVGAAAAVSRDERRVDAPTVESQVGAPSVESQVGEPAGDEYAVGEPTTYGTDGGDAVAVDEQPQDDGRGYHDDTTLVGEDEPVDTTTDAASTTDYEAGTAVGGATSAEGRLDTPGASYEQGDLLEQPETDGGIEERGAGSAYAEPGVTSVEDTTGSADLGDTTVADHTAVDGTTTADATGDVTTADAGGAGAGAAGGAGAGAAGGAGAVAAGGAGAVAAGGAGSTVFAESAYGPGSAEPGEDGAGPAGWEIKGNSGSMLFHTPESPSYDAVRAEVWFESEETARAAGFAHWDRRRR